MLARSTAADAANMAAESMFWPAHAPGPFSAAQPWTSRYLYQYGCTRAAYAMIWSTDVDAYYGTTVDVV